MFLKYDCFYINDSAVEGEGGHQQKHLKLVENIVSAQKTMCGWEARGLRLVPNMRGSSHGLRAHPTPLNTPLDIGTFCAAIYILLPGFTFCCRDLHFAAGILLFAAGILLFAAGVLLFAAGILLFAAGVLHFAAGVLHFAAGFTFCCRGIHFAAVVYILLPWYTLM